MINRKLIRKVWIWFVFSSSIVFNLLFFCIDILPVTKRKLEKPIFLKDTSHDEVEQKTVNASFNMFASSKIHMPYGRHLSFVEKISSMRIKDINRINYFPRAYLALGLIKYANKFDQELLNKVIPIYDEYYIYNDELNFEFEYVDQVPLAYSALELYKITGDLKYKNVADSVFKKLKAMVIHHHGYSLILYRNHQNDILVDVIGLVVPFLMEYGNYFKNKEAINLAVSQLSFFTEYGLDSDTGLPFHAVDIETKVGLGPNNWGRGMGWYMLALKSMARTSISGQDSFLLKTPKIALFINSLQVIKDSTIYTQFPGTSNDFDSSSSTMLMYGENVMRTNVFSKKEILTVYKPYIRENGQLDYCSAEAFGVNKYSLEFGTSEFSQGMLLLLLSSTK